MYRHYFGLREMPFGITPDIGFVFACRSHQDALDTLLFALANAEGFIKVTGDVGTGKTLLCRRFVATLDQHRVVAYIPNPYLEPRTLLLALADELKVDVPRDVDQHLVLKRLTRALIEIAQGGKAAVVCIDEAQAMPVETLEALRLLTNLETEKRKLLQVVLFGQPELDQKLAAASMRQLRSRITFQSELTALMREEVGLYLDHRLRVAGYVGASLFPSRAVRLIHSATGGVPRLINILANKALTAAYDEGVSCVLPRHIRAARAHTPAANHQPRRWWWYGAMR